MAIVFLIFAMEFQSDPTSVFGKETLACIPETNNSIESPCDKFKTISASPKSSTVGTMKDTSIEDVTSDRLKPLILKIPKTLLDSNLPKNCPMSAASCTDTECHQEVLIKVPSNDDNQVVNKARNGDNQEVLNEALGNDDNQVVNKARNGDNQEVLNEALGNVNKQEVLNEVLSNCDNEEVLNETPNNGDNQEVPHETPTNSENREQCQQDMEWDCSRDSTSNSNCQCSNRDEECQSNVPESPGSFESPSDSLDASRYDEIINVDLRRTRRSSKRKKDCDLCCPVCGLTLRSPELDSHFNQEVDKLGKISKTLKKPKRDDSGINTTFVQVRSNRLNRLSAQVAKYAEKAEKELKCPVCKLSIYGSQEDMDNHVAVCYQYDESEEFINVDEDEDDTESFEEYEFGDQTRVRTISLVPGGYRSLEGQNVKRPREDDDEDLDVDIDDTMAFGQPQYSELDVILNKNEDKATDQLRKSVLVDPSIQPHVLESRKWSTSEDVSEVPKSLSEASVTSAEDKIEDKEAAEQSDAISGHIISSLKEKIKDLGDQSKDVKCLICMEHYTKPVVSTTCWHVYCEECWLMTMGVKKLCPQCNMIVFPTDLRRIYL